MPRRIAIHYPLKDGKIEPYIKNIYEKLSAGLDTEFGIDISVMNMLQAYTLWNFRGPERHTGRA